MLREGIDCRMLPEDLPREEIRHVRPALSCRACESMVQAPIPSLPVHRGLLSPGLLAQVLVSKYCVHLPLYRQSQIHARKGLTLEPFLLAGWVGKSVSLMAPPVEAIGRHVLAGDHIHADGRNARRRRDTPVPVLVPGTGKTRQADALLDRIAAPGSGFRQALGR
jgi:transposase